MASMLHIANLVRDESIWLLHMKHTCSISGRRQVANRA